MGLQMFPWTLLSLMAFIVYIVQGMPNDCKDKQKHCSGYDLSYICNGKYKPWAMEFCRLSCNLCNEDPTEQQAECKDLYADCGKYGGRDQDCVRNTFNAYVTCRKYCGLCDPSKAFTGAKSNKKSCTFSPTNTVYEHEMEWDDLCMTCKCDDGKWSCNNLVCMHPQNQNRCTSHYNDPKDCCPTWVCPDGKWTTCSAVIDKKDSKCMEP